VITYVSEAANRSSMGMLSSAVGATCCLAYSLSAFVVWTMRVCLTEDQMTLWGWRVPFLLSALPAYYCLSRLSRMEVLPACAHPHSPRVRRACAARARARGGTELARSALEAASIRAMTGALLLPFLS